MKFGIASPKVWSSAFRRLRNRVNAELQTKRFRHSFALAKSDALYHFHVMESHELLREIFETKTPKEVSADLELSTSMVYKWAQPRAGEGRSEEHTSEL